MSNQIHYTLCPVCGSAGISEVFKVKDNTVSQEYFEIDHCRNCQARFTQNPPSEASIGAYYKSEDYISHTDTSKGLINRIYRLVRNFSINQNKNLVEKNNCLNFCSPKYLRNTKITLNQNTAMLTTVTFAHTW